MTKRESTPAVELRDVRVRYGTDTTLQLDELSLPTGERLGIIGPNGAGKSTLLRVAALLQRPNEGSVRVLGDSVWPEQPGLELRRRIAVVFQNPLLLDMTVLNNVAVGLRIRGLTREQVHERADNWLRTFGVWELRDRGIHGLSGGEAQRVSLARAFAVDPDIMLMDEPFANLDLPTRQQLLGEVRDVLETTQTTTMLVSHDFYEVFRLCHRVVALFGGKSVADGAPNHMLRHGNHEAVRAFLQPWKELSTWQDGS